MDQKRSYYPPATTRSSLMLQVAAKLVAAREWPYRQARVSLREQGAEDWVTCFLGSDTPDVINEVARGTIHVAAVNPSAVLTLAVRGTGPFREPLPLRAIAVIPSADQLGFAVSERTGLRSLSDIRERRFPLRLSVRGQRNHSLHLILGEVFRVVGFSFEDIVAWGGKVFYDEGHQDDPHGFRGRVGAVRRGEADAIFDEALNLWVNIAVGTGMRFLSLEEPLLQKLEKIGLRRAVISEREFTRLDRDVTTVDFSGWPVYTHANVPEKLITPFCLALEECRGSIPWQGEGPLPLERMCRDTPEAPLGIPLHPAAEIFWRGRGYLS